MMEQLLEIKKLEVKLISDRGLVRAVQGIDLMLGRGEIHGLVGESGCGKTMTAKAILRLLDEKKTIYSGEIRFNGMDLLDRKKKELKSIRGRSISMIFQDPSISLNPLFTVGEQISETLRRHSGMNRAEARLEALKLLEKVGIEPAAVRYMQYPFEFSGGMLQRIMLAIAIAMKPRLLIADEPTTALDVTIQAQTLELIKTLQRSSNMSVLLITHNFGVVAEICDTVSVMYAGKIVETGGVHQLFDNPAHPYTKALMASIPKTGHRGEELEVIPGTPPDLLEEQSGCAFCPRCTFAMEVCKSVEPPWRQVSEGHSFRCHLG